MSTVELFSDFAQSDRDRLAFFDTTRFLAHGHTVYRRRLAAGKSYTMELVADTPVEAVDLPTAWTKGRIVASANAAYPYRVPGSFTKGRTTPYAKGVYTYVVEEDSEWWCVPGCMSITSLLTVPAGDSVLLPKGTLGLVLIGNLSVGDTTIAASTPFSLSSSDGTAIAGEETVYAFVFEYAATT